MMFNNACRTCHTIRDGDNRLAPNLYGIIGRKSGTARGYSNYSSSMQNADVVWDEKNLEQFIADPGAVVSGNNMKPFSGIVSRRSAGRSCNFLRTAALAGRRALPLACAAAADLPHVKMWPEAASGKLR